MNRQEIIDRMQKNLDLNARAVQKVRGALGEEEFTRLVRRLPQELQKMLQ